MIIFKEDKMPPEDRFVVGNNSKGWYVFDMKKKDVVDNRYFNQSWEAINYRNREVKLNT
jgi:hypothetical protein